MKLQVLLLVALSFLLGACSSFRSPPPVAKRTVPPAVRAENKITTFGELPSYDPRGQYFKLYTSLREYERALNGRAVVDVIVNADGTVQDAAIFESSGDPAVDEMALRLYKNSRYSLRLSPGDPAPYVVRQQFLALNPHRVQSIGVGPNYTDTSSKYSDVTPMGQGAKHWTDK
jgi:TonB family protein